MIDIFPIALVLLLIIGSKPVKPLCATNEEYLSLETSKKYRGFFALIIILHHLSQKTTTGVIFPLFLKAGSLAVAFFFFLSGYGLQKSYILKSTKYRKTFFANRIPGIVIPYLIFVIIYLLADSIAGTGYSTADVFNSFINGRPIVIYSWYIIVILLFYLFYWLFMVLCHNHKWIILCGSIWYIAWILLCWKINYSAWWFNTAHLLILGLIWATYETKINIIVKKHYKLIALFVWICFIALFIFQDKIIPLFPHQFTLSFVFQFFLTLLFVCGVILLSMKIRIGNRMFDHLGNISLELYLVHGLFIQYLKIQNEFVRCLAVIVLSVVTAFILHIAISCILKKYRNLIS